jgi:hypothetical protein
MKQLICYRHNKSYDPRKPEAWFCTTLLVVMLGDAQSVRRTGMLIDDVVRAARRHATGCHAGG